MRRRFSTPELLLLGAVFFWAFNFTATKYALTHGFRPLTYGALRFGLAGLTFAGIALVREGSLRVQRSDLPLIAVAAVFGTWLNQFAFVYALRLTTAATVALLFGALPILIGIVAHASGVERIRGRTWAAAAVSLGGVALVATGAKGGISADLGGILLGLATVVSLAFFAVSVGPLMRRYSSLRLNAVVTLAGGTGLAATASGQLAGQDWGAPNRLAWGAFVFSLLPAYVLTNLVWFYAIHRVGPARSALYINLEPFIGAVFALLVLSESLGPLQWVGGGVIALGIFAAGRHEAE